MLEEAVSYAVRGDWRGRTIRGGALALPVVALVPATLLVEPLLGILAMAAVVPLAGYALRILGEPVADREPPSFAAWGDLLRAGLVGIGVWAVYAILPGALVASILVTALGTGGTATLAVGIVAGSLCALGAYLAPAAVATVSRSGSLSGAADLGGVAAAASGRPYVAATLQSLVIWFAAFGVAVMLLVTVFGLVLVPAVGFLALVVVARLYALAVAATIDPAGATAVREESMPGL